jgi:hypothetical protein
MRRRRALPHQLCHFHYPREAARPISEADRHARKEHNKRVRGIRPLEREMEGRTDAQAQAILGYCSAVRSAVTNDGRPAQEVSDLKLQERLTAIHDSLGQIAKQGAADTIEKAPDHPRPRVVRDGEAVA